MISGFASPGEPYLQSLGELVYAVSSMEWTILGDLRHLARHLPPDLTLEALSSKPTGKIARSLRHSLPKVTDQATRDYLAAAAASLGDAATLRNHVMHARPATVDGEQRLYRWTDGGTHGSHAFPITPEWLDQALREMQRLADALHAARP